MLVKGDSQDSHRAVWLRRLSSSPHYPPTVRDKKRCPPHWCQGSSMLETQKASQTPLLHHHSDLFDRPSCQVHPIPFSPPAPTTTLRHLPIAEDNCNGLPASTFAYHLPSLSSPHSAESTHQSTSFACLEPSALCHHTEHTVWTLHHDS